MIGQDIMKSTNRNPTTSRNLITVAVVTLVMFVLTRLFITQNFAVEMSKISVDNQLSSHHGTVQGQFIDGKRVEEDRTEQALSYILKYEYEIRPGKIVTGSSPVRTGELRLLKLNEIEASHLSTHPQPCMVEYDPQHPEISRLQGTRYQSAQTEASIRLNAILCTGLLGIVYVALVAQPVENLVKVWREGRD